MSHCIGVIAENRSDVAVIEALIHKIAPKATFAVKSMVGEGSGAIIGKCLRWASVLRDRGCSTLILTRDLDENSLPQLRGRLEHALNGCTLSRRVVVIPVREIEAWLLSDSPAIQRAMNLPMAVPRIADPQIILDAKARLSEIIYIRSGKTRRYINTVHNPRIAAEIQLPNIRRCSSFGPLEAFVRQYIH